MRDDRPVGSPKEWSTVRTVLMNLLFVGFFCFLVISIIAGPPDLSKYSRYFAWLGVLAGSAFGMRVLYLLVKDLVQYIKEGWNIDGRPPRLRIGAGVLGARGRPLTPKENMWIGYPAVLIMCWIVTLVSIIELNK